MAKETEEEKEEKRVQLLRWNGWQHNINKLLDINQDQFYKTYLRKWQHHLLWLLQCRGFSTIIFFNNLFVVLFMFQLGNAFYIFIFIS